MRELESHNYDYDGTIADLVAHFSPLNTHYSVNQVADYFHGIYLRKALSDKRHRFPQLLGYLQSAKVAIYNKLLPLAIQAPDASQQAQLEQLILGTLLNDYPAEIPSVNRLLLVPDALPQIRSNRGGMVEFLDSVRYSLATKNWFGALFMALALPDICGAVEHGKANGPHYKDWYTRYLKPIYDPDNVGGLSTAHANAIKFTADECYQFRCKTLHEGLQQKEKQPSAASRIEFSPTSGVTLHCSYSNGKWWLSVGLFSEDVCQAVEKWLVDVAGDAAIQARLADLMTI